MTDLEKALTYYDGNNEMPYCDLVYNALKKQQPMEADAFHALFWRCPKCKNVFNNTKIYGYNPNFCPYCGQALNWSSYD